MMHRFLIVGLSISCLSACSWFVEPPTRADDPIVQGVNYVGMTVSDIEATTKLYQDASQVERVKSKRIENDTTYQTLAQREQVSLTTQLIRSVNAQLLLMQFDSPSSEAQKSRSVDANAVGIAHLAFQAVDKTQTYEKFLSGGAEHIGSLEMMTNPRTHVSYAYVHDKDDLIIEVEHVDIEALELPQPPKNEIRIRHISLATANMERLIDFYSALLETENPRQSGYLFPNSGEFIDNVSGLPDSEVEFAWFQVRNLELEIIQYHNPEPENKLNTRPIDATGFNMIVFDVKDVARAKQLFLEAGGTLVMDAGHLAGEPVFFGRDPDGNLLGFQALSEASPYSAKNFKDNGLG